MRSEYLLTINSQYCFNLLKGIFPEYDALSTGLTRCRLYSGSAPPQAADVHTTSPTVGTLAKISGTGAQTPLPPVQKNQHAAEVKLPSNEHMEDLLLEAIKNVQKNAHYLSIMCQQGAQIVLRHNHMRGNKKESVYSQCTVYLRT